MKKRILKYTQILFAFVCMLFVFEINTYALGQITTTLTETQIAEGYYYDETLGKIVCNKQGVLFDQYGKKIDTTATPGFDADESVEVKDTVPTDDKNNFETIDVYTPECDETRGCKECEDGYYYDEETQLCTTQYKEIKFPVDPNSDLSNKNWTSTDKIQDECKTATEFSHIEYEYQCVDKNDKEIRFYSVDGKNDDCKKDAKRTGPQTSRYKLKYDTTEKLEACYAQKVNDGIQKVLEEGFNWATETKAPQFCSIPYKIPITFWVNDVQITGICYIQGTGNPNERVFIKDNGKKTLIYYFNGEYGSNIELYEPTIEIASSHYGLSKHISINEFGADGNNATLWKKNQGKSNVLGETSKSYYFYILNIDNPSSKYYNRNGRYKLLSKNKTGALGPNSCSKVQDPECEVITLSSAQNDAQGINYVKRVRFQDEWYDVYVYSTIYYKIYLKEVNTGLDNVKYAQSYTAKLVGTAQPGHATSQMIPIFTGTPEKVCQVNRYLKPTQPIVQKMVTDNIVEETTLLEIINTHENEKNKYLNLDVWNELETLKETASVNVYGGYNTSGDINIGEIVYNQLGEPNEEGLVAGSWIYKQKRQPLEISQAYLLYPTVKYEERTYTVCIGKYNCECEDINVLCSCEDEEAGCPPDIGAPEGSGDDDDGCPQGPVADNYGADETNPKVYNEKGMSVLSGGCGGITGKGSTDYMDKYLTIGSTIIQ